MEYVAIVTILLLVQANLFALHVGRMRAEHEVKAPLVDGPEAFLRSFRVHQNSLEQLISVLPAMWLFGWYLNAPTAAALGLVYMIARFMYRTGYLKDPGKRAAGFGLGFVVLVLLLVGGLAGAVMRLLA